MFLISLPPYLLIYSTILVTLESVYPLVYSWKFDYSTPLPSNRLPSNRSGGVRVWHVGHFMAIWVFGAKCRYSQFLFFCGHLKLGCVPFFFLFVFLPQTRGGTKRETKTNGQGNSNNEYIYNNRVNQMLVNRHVSPRILGTWKIFKLFQVVVGLVVVGVGHKQNVLWN